MRKLLSAVLSVALMTSSIVFMPAMETKAADGAGEIAAQSLAEEVTPSTDIRTVYVDTNGAEVTKTKVNAEIVIMDKVGGDSYEDNVVYDTIAGTGTIKVRGNSTSNADKKPFNISFSSKQNVFGMGKAKKWSLLANAFDKSLVRNRLAMEFAAALGLDYTSQSTYVDLYINGQYYGNYLLIESVETGSSRVDIDTDNGSDILLEREKDRVEDEMSYMTTTKYGIRFAVGDPEGLDPATAQYSNTLQTLNDFETALETGDYDTFSQYIDVASFVNFYIVNELFKNIDFNFSSTRFYIKDGTLYAGPLWDLDLSSGNAKSSYYPDYYENGVSYRGLYCQNFTWFRVLMENSIFKQKVLSRYKEVQPLIENIISGTTGNSIDAIVNAYAASFARNYLPTSQGGAGWSVSRADSGDYYSFAGESGWTTLQDTTDFLKNWLTNRNTYLLEEFAKVNLGSVTSTTSYIDGVTYENLLQKVDATATASSIETNDLTADKAIDKDTGSRWASAQSDNQSIVVDLGGVYDLKAFSILWEAASAATYAVQVSEDGRNFTNAATYSSSTGARKDDIVLDKKVSARYVKIDCYTRTTPYGFSIYEMAFWGKDPAAVVISDDMIINGYQISSTLGGMRTVYSMDSTVEGQAVTEFGLVYGIGRDGFDEADMLAGSENDSVYTSPGTVDNGQLADAVSKSSSYVMTMKFAAGTKAEYQTEYYVRAYAKLADGTYAYTNIKKYTIYDIADTLYQSVGMSNYQSHNYLYEKILKIVQPDYTVKDYDWNQSLVIGK